MPSCGTPGCATSARCRGKPRGGQCMQRLLLPTAQWNTSYQDLSSKSVDFTHAVSGLRPGRTLRTRLALVCERSTARARRLWKRLFRLAGRNASLRSNRPCACAATHACTLLRAVCVPALNGRRPQQPAPTSPGSKCNMAEVQVFCRKMQCLLPPPGACDVWHCEHCPQQYTTQSSL